MDRMVGISIVHRDKVIAKDEGGGMGMGEGDGKSDLLRDSVVVENQRFADSVERR